MNKSRGRLVFVVLVGITVIGAVGLRQSLGPKAYRHRHLAPQYTVKALDLLFGDPRCGPLGMNDSGVIVGSGDPHNPGEQAPFVTKNGNVTIVAAARDYWAGVADINNRGSMIGMGGNRASALISGQLIDIGTLGGDRTTAMQINDADIIVGTSNTQVNGTEFHAFEWKDGIMADLGTLRGFSCSTATAINSKGQIVGSSGTDWRGEDSHAFLWDSGKMTDLGTLGGKSSWAEGINDSGVICGYSQLPNGETHACEWIDGHIRDLAQGYECDGVGPMNNRGEIVGLFKQPGGTDEPWVFRNGTTYALNDIIPQNRGWRILVPLVINNRGEILCDANKDYCLLEPIATVK